jgi:hypothetical protein
LSASDLRAAEREASAIYASAGIELVWILGHPEAPGASTTVRVVLLDAQMTRSKGIMQSSLQLLYASDRYFTEVQATALRSLVAVRN